MAEIIFYTNPNSRGRIVHWMLEELGEPYDTVCLEYGDAGMKATEFLQINPMGKVPVVVCHDKIITETPAICNFLAARYPDKQLMPDYDDPALADFYRWMYFAAGPLELAVTVNAMALEVPQERERSVGFGNIDNVHAALELALQSGLFVCGDRFTAVDVYLGSHLNWGMAFGTLKKTPLISDYVQRLLERPAAIRAEKLNDEKALP